VAEAVKEVLAEHAPKAAEHGARAAAANRKSFLEEMEQYNAEMLTPLIDHLRASGTMPPEIDKMLEAIRNPEAQIGGILSSFFTYGVMFQLAGNVLQPFFQSVSNYVWQQFPDRPISPADLATGAVRGITPGSKPITTYPEAINTEAGKSGVPPADMQYLADITGNPPSPQDLLEMKRRGIITEAQLATGLKEGDTRDEWVPMFEKLINQWVSPTDFVNAAVREQIPRGIARAWAHAAGLDTSWDVSADPGPQLAGPEPTTAPAVSMFDLMFDIAGRPPGPEQLGHMTLRNIIKQTNKDAGLPSPDPTATTFEQGIAESDIKTKWTDALWKLQQYIPPPRMIGGLLEKGGITETQARAYWTMGGVPTDLVDAYVFEAAQQATEQEKLLAKGSILTAYFDMIIDRGTAKELLTLLGYGGAAYPLTVAGKPTDTPPAKPTPFTVADIMLDTVDMRREIKAMNAEVNHIGSYYRGYKINPTETGDALKALGVPAPQITELLAIWSVDRIEPIRLPTVSQIAKAVKYATLSPAEAIAKMQLLGYTAYDASIVLSAEGEFAIAELPPQTGNPPPVV
jgi:hypothetical protein